MFGKNLFKNKEKKIAKVVVIKLTTHKGSDIEQIIYVPPGCEFVVGSYLNDYLLDKDGTVIKEYNWIAGYTKIYTYIYDEKDVLPSDKEESV
jgi:hypothetical protein